MSDCQILSMADACLQMYHIVGNFRGRTLSRISHFCSYSWKFSPWNFWGHGILWHGKSKQSAKVLSVKFGGVASFGTAKVSNPQKFSPQKLYLSTICESFLPQSFAKVFSLKSFLLYCTMSIMTLYLPSKPMHIDLSDQKCTLTICNLRCEIDT